MGAGEKVDEDAGGANGMGMGMGMGMDRICVVGDRTILISYVLHLF